MHLLSRMMKFGLRVLAWVSSLALLVILLVVLILTQPNAFTPSLVNFAAARLGNDFHVERLGLGWEDENAVLSISGLAMQRDTPQGRVQLWIDRFDVRVTIPIFELQKWEVSHVDIINPQIVFHHSVRHRRTADQHRTSSVDTSSIMTGLNFLSHLRRVVVSGGEYEFRYDTGAQPVTFSGGFEVDGNSEGLSKIVLLQMTSNESSQTQVTLTVATTESINAAMQTDLELIAHSIEFARLVPMLGDSMKVERMELARLESLVNAKVNASWSGSELAALNFSVDVNDPHFDGDIADVARAHFTAQGVLQLNDSKAERVDVNFTLNALDMVAAFKHVPGAFPPKFYQHASERLTSLWLTGLHGTLSFNPKTILETNSDWNLTGEGDFANLTYRFGDRWPPLENTSGTYQLRDRQVVITADVGSLYEYPLQRGIATIDDFMHSDPIMTVAADIDLPLKVAFDLFGEDGMVSPNKLNWIIKGNGEGTVALNVDVPLRRGKEFVLTGHVDLTDTRVLTTQGIQMDDLSGRLQFNRVGVTAGNLRGTMLGGAFNTEFKGSGGQGNYTATGKAAGRASANALKMIADGSITERLTGYMDWEADYSFAANQNELEVTSSLTNLVSTLPFPMQKGAGESLPLNLAMRTKNKTERTITLSLGKDLQATLQAEFRGDKWRSRAGTVAIGGAPVVLDESGYKVAVDLPQLDYDDWSKLLKATEVSNNLESSTALKSVVIDVDELILPGNYKLQQANIVADKEKSYWNIKLSTASVKGTARYQSAEFTSADESPSLQLNLSICHLDNTEKNAAQPPTDPVNLPAIELQCEDMRYGQYHLGKSVIIAEPNDTSWRISRAEFEMPTFTLKATGDWFYDQTSKIEFQLNSTDFGRSMEVLGYSGLFEQGVAEVSGILEWDAALTRWTTHRVSGNIELSAKQGAVVKNEHQRALKFIGALNYDTILQKFSHDVVDVLDQDGILYDTLTGTAKLTKGVFEINGIYLEGPSVSMAMTGSSNWNDRQHQLLLGVEPQIKNSLTTLTTVLINPVTGTLVYLGSKLAEQMDIKFSYRYDITGTWEAPVITRKRGKQISSRTSFEALTRVHS